MELHVAGYYHHTMGTVKQHVCFIRLDFTILFSVFNYFDFLNKSG